jgi:DNA 3'-phosphatase
MRLVQLLAPLGFLAPLAFACSAPTTDADELDATSCEGAKLDAKGICRKPTGKYAAKVCCAAPPTYAKTRQSLDAYTCPAGGAKSKVAFFDADNTLRVSRSGAPTANTKDDVFILPFTATTIAGLNKDGYLTAIVSNQGGVASGQTTLEVAEGALVYVASHLNDLGARIDYLDFAENNDEFRKPKTGMAELLDELLADKCGAGIDWEASFMVGDAGYKKGVDGPHPDGRPADDFSNSDRGLAENLGVPFSEPTDYFAWRDFGYFNILYKSDLVGLLNNIDEEIADLEDTGDDPERAAALADEVAKNRAINGL